MKKFFCLFATALSFSTGLMAAKPATIDEKIELCSYVGDMEYAIGYQQGLNGGLPPSSSYYPEYSAGYEAGRRQGIINRGF